MVRVSGVRRIDLVAAPVCEAALLAIAGMAGWLFHAPLLFASLGPTAYELIETPERKSARPYNVLVGHSIGVLAGFGTLWVMGASGAASVGPHGVPLVRMAAAAVAAAVTVLATLAARATQPAAAATTLLIALGTMRGWRSGAAILGAVVLMVLVGEPLRRWRERERHGSPALS